MKEKQDKVKIIIRVGRGIRLRLKALAVKESRTMGEMLEFLLDFYEQVRGKNK